MPRNTFICASFRLESGLPIMNEILLLNLNELEILDIFESGKKCWNFAVFRQIRLNFGFKRVLLWLHHSGRIRPPSVNMKVFYPMVPMDQFKEGLQILYKVRILWSLCIMNTIFGILNVPGMYPTYSFCKSCEKMSRLRIFTRIIQ